MKLLHVLSAVLLSAAPMAAQGAFLGVQMAPTDQGSGVSVVEVTKASAAEIMGIRKGDVLHAVDGKEVVGPKDFAARIQRHSPGDLVTIGITRGDQQMELRGLLGRLPGVGPLHPAFPFPEGFERGHFPGMDDLFGDLDKMKGMELPKEFLDQLGDMRMRIGEFPDGFEMRFFTLPDGMKGHTKVTIRYPGDTPKEDRDRLVEEAKRKYGEDVKVEFEGEGTSIRMESSFQSGGMDAGEGLEDESEGNEDTFENVPELLRKADSVTPPKASATHWHANLDEALAAAEKSGKPVLVDFYAEWCGPCKRLAKTVLDNPEHTDLMASFEAVRVDIDRNRELAEKYQVQSIPDVRILDAESNEISRLVGFGGEKATVQSLKQILKERDRTQEGGQGKAEGKTPPHAQEKGQDGDSDQRAAAQERQRALQREALRKRMTEVQAQLEELEKQLHRLEDE